MKEQGKSSPEQTNDDQTGNLLEKRIQNNDSKDDPKSWK